MPAHHFPRLVKTVERQIERSERGQPSFWGVPELRRLRRRLVVAALVASVSMCA